MLDGQEKSCRQKAGRQSPIGRRLRGVFWQELDGWLDNLGKKAELKLVAEVLCGRLQASPFGGLPSRIAGAWAAVLKEAGLEGSGGGLRRSGLWVPRQIG